MRTCRHHGGRSPVGAAAAAYKHGRYSRHLPSNMLAAYRATLDDPEKLALDSELGVLDARIATILNRLATPESAQTYQRLCAALDKIQAARNLNRPIDGPLREAKALAARGAGDEAAWEEIRALIDTRRKVATAEVRRMFAAQEVLRRDEATALWTSLLEAVQDCVPDLAARQAVHNRFMQLVGRQFEPPALTGD